MQQLLDHLIAFLKAQSHGLPRELKIILALSGGSDSIGLLHLLLRAREKIPFELYAAHLNHNWREESSDEASQLEAHCKQIGIPLFTKTLPPNQKITGNLEDYGRQARLLFFREVLAATYSDAIITAHHGSDQVETMLKRFFEGAHLSTLKGMDSKTMIQEVPLWRPLLPFPKEKLLAWSDTYAFPYFIDKTNLDPSFLRGRIRSQLLPLLNEVFSTSIETNLLRFCADLNPAPPHLPPTNNRSNVLAAYTPLKNTENLWEVKSFIRYFCVNNHIEMPSHSLIDQISSSLFKRDSNKKFLWAGHFFIVDRGILFYLWSELTPLNWEITPLGITSQAPKKFQWEDIFNGKFIYSLDLNSLPSCMQGLSPEEILSHIVWKPSFPSGKIQNQKPLCQWWCNHKIPQFIRSWVPVPTFENIIVGEILTGFTYHPKLPNPKNPSGWLNLYCNYSAPI